MHYQIEYEGNLRTKITSSTSSAVLITDAPKDNHGLGTAFSPTDLLAVSLGSCMMTIMALAAKKQGLDLIGANMRVEKSMALQPRRVAKIAIYFSCPLSLSVTQRELLEKAAYDCPVHHSLHPDIVVTCHFSWGPVA